MCGDCFGQQNERRIVCFSRTQSGFQSFELSTKSHLEVGKLKVGRGIETHDIGEDSRGEGGRGVRHGWSLLGAVELHLNSI